MTDKPYFLHSLTLRNFMLHRLTKLSLGTHPIILLTGANGSGKTQILDAFILTMGGHPRRIKKGRITDAIGPFDDTASVELTVRNPLVDGQRLLSIPDKKLMELVDANRFSIVVDIHPESGTSYFVLAGKKRRRVQRKDIRTILYELNLRAENKLAFTEEGTVNVFSDHSDKNKLDLLLDTTGLTAYRENIAGTMDSIEKATRSLDPLRRKQSLEKEYLRSMKKSREQIRQKQGLIDRHKELVNEEAWSRVKKERRELGDIEAKLEKKKREHHKSASGYQKLESEYRRYQDACKKLQEQKRRLYREMGEMENRRSVLEGSNNSDRGQKQRLEKKRESIEERRARLQDPQRIARRKDLKNELEKLRKEKQRMVQVKENLGERFFAPETAGERDILAQVVKFYDAAKKQRIELCGPLFHEISLEPGDKGQALVQALGEHLFTFIAKPSHFQAALALAKKLWQQAPPFFIACLPQPEKNARLSLKFIKAPRLASYFVEHILKIRINIDCDESELPEMAQKRGQIICHNGYVYLPYRAVGGGRGFALTLRDGKLLSIDEIREALGIENFFVALAEREQGLQEEFDELEDSEELRYLKEQVEECERDILELTAQIAKSEVEAEKLRVQIEEIDRDYRDIGQELEGQQKFLQENTHELNRLESEQETLEKSMNRWEQAREEQAVKLQEFIEKANQLGDCPEQVRSLQTVTQERVHMEGKLETMDITALITEEDYLAQEEKVKKLETELAGSDEHLKNLRSDVAKRFSHWHTEVSRRIRDISRAMNSLLSGTIQGVRLRVDNLKDPARAGLQIEVKRHSQNWHDLAQLSGGEKVLTVESLILALHLQADSPVHAIDECTQRLDMKFKAQAFEMVQNAIEEIGQVNSGPFAPQFILLAPDTLGIEFGPDFDDYFKQIVLGPAQIKGKGKKVS